jgi:flavin-dependent dehydrogenase
MNLKKYDIAIIGGGPSGSSAAMLLSKSGYSVAIIEKKSFPREVLCGEFISSEVIEFLKMNMLFQELLKLCPSPISSFRFSSESGREIYSSLKFTAYGIKRSKLDNFLLSKAVGNGTEIYQPYEVTGILKLNDTYILNLIGQSKENITIEARIIIAAYGRQNILDKNSGRDSYWKKSRLNGVKFHIDKSHFNDFNSDEIQIYTARDIYCGLNSVDNSTITLCFLSKRNEFQYSTKELVMQLSKQNKKFNSLLKGDFFESLEKLPVYGTGNIYFGKRDIVRDGIFYIGDAAGVIAPLVGDGIGMAVQSASLVSRILIKDNLMKETAGNEYKKEWPKMFIRRIRIAGFIQKSVLNNTFRNAGVMIVSLIPGAIPSLIKYTRG